MNQASSSPTFDNAFGNFVRAIAREVAQEFAGNSPQSLPTKPRLISVKDAAEYLAISKREVYNMIANRELKAVVHGRRKMLERADLELWVEENKR
jgi:excisionase family DNA binding protein